jgi:hypothetical protein
VIISKQNLGGGHSGETIIAPGPAAAIRIFCTRVK